MLVLNYHHDFAQRISHASVTSSTKNYSIADSNYFSELEVGSLVLTVKGIVLSLPVSRSNAPKIPSNSAVIQIIFRWCKTNQV